MYRSYNVILELVLTHCLFIDGLTKAECQLTSDLLDHYTTYMKAVVYCLLNHNLCGCVPENTKLATCESKRWSTIDHQMHNGYLQLILSGNKYQISTEACFSKMNKQQVFNLHKIYKKKIYKSQFRKISILMISFLFYR